MVTILEGVRVLEWTICEQGPVATALLEDMGAEVIKIEERNAGGPAHDIMKVVDAIISQAVGGPNACYENNNRSKKRIALDLTKPEAKEIIYHLVGKSDVFVLNFSKGVAEKIGMDYKTLSKYNPRLIYASVSGWGPDGRGAFEPFAHYTGVEKPGVPPQMVQGELGDQAGDIVTAFGVVSALLARERFGVAQEFNTPIPAGLVYPRGLPHGAEFGHLTGGKFKVMAHPFTFAKTPMKIHREVPEFSEHTEEVLTQMLGYSSQQIEYLRRQEVI